MPYQDELKKAAKVFVEETNEGRAEDGIVVTWSDILVDRVVSAGVSIGDRVLVAVPSKKLDAVYAVLDEPAPKAKKGK